MAKKATTKTRRNPNDATFRNITALRKRVEILERQVKDIVEYHGGVILSVRDRKGKR